MQIKTKYITLFTFIILMMSCSVLKNKQGCNFDGKQEGFLITDYNSTCFYRTKLNTKKSKIEDFYSLPDTVEGFILGKITDSKARGDIWNLRDTVEIRDHINLAIALEKTEYSDTIVYKSYRNFVIINRIKIDSKADENFSKHYKDKICDIQYNVWEIDSTKKFFKTYLKRQRIKSIEVID